MPFYVILGKIERRRGLVDKEEVSKVEETTPKLDISEVLNDYSLAELKFQACENKLLGNFDQNKNYKIMDIIYPELINIQKILGKRSSDFYTASCYIEQTTLNFIIKIEKSEDKMISATLILQEKLVFAKNFETIISTPLKTITDVDTPDFAFKVRSAFHLINAEDADELTLFENYVSPPIELVTELIKKAEVLEALKNGRDKLENEYISSILKTLKKTEVGTALAKSFFAIVKQNDLHEEKENRTRKFKQLLDFLIDEKIAENALPEETLEEIASIRNTFNIESKKETFNFMQTKNKSGFKGFIGVKKNPDKSVEPPAPKVEQKPSKTEKTESFGGSSGGTKTSKQEKKVEKPDKYTPIFAPLGNKPKSSIKKPILPKPLKQKEEPIKPIIPEQDLPPQQPKPQPKADLRLSASILGRAKQDGFQPKVEIVVEEVVGYEVYKSSIETAVSTNYGVEKVRVDMMEVKEIKKETKYEVDLER